MNQIPYFLLVTKPMERGIRFMLTESIVRKTLGLKRFCVKEVKEKDGQLLMYLSGDKRYKLVCSRCGRKMPGYDRLAERRWKHVPVWGIPVVLICAPGGSNVQLVGSRWRRSPGHKEKAPFLSHSV